MQNLLLAHVPGPPEVEQQYADTDVVTKIYRGMKSPTLESFYLIVDGRDRSIKYMLEMAKAGRCVLSRKF